MDLNYDLIDWIEDVHKWIKSHRCIRAQLTFVLLRFLASSLALLGHMAVASTINFGYDMTARRQHNEKYYHLMPQEIFPEIWIPAVSQYETDQ